VSKRLYEKHKEYEAHLNKLEQEIIKEEMKECSFKPHRVTKSKDKKFLMKQKSVDGA
jgi:hypothetical protein